MKYRRNLDAGEVASAMRDLLAAWPDLQQIAAARNFIGWQNYSLPVCKWDGIMCEGNDVTGLNFTGWGLSGTVCLYIVS